MSSSKSAAVSFIIPCFNMERWIEQAIESCLRQKNIRPDVIVIDDGSSDRSLEIIQRFGGRIRWESFTENRGVNAARNRGLSLATGDFVLFLDADDLLAPDIIYWQATLLEDQGGDICYGDWQWLVTNQNGTARFQRNPKKRQREDDLTVSLLKDWWCPPFSYLYRKSFILRHKIFWNQNLGFPDDFEYILRVSLQCPRVVHLPAVTGYYRKHTGKRLSEIAREQWMKNIVFIYELAEDELKKQGRWKEPYVDAVCSGYLNIGRHMFSHDPRYFRQMLDKIHRLKPGFRAARKRYRWAAKLLGYEQAERLSWFKRRVRGAIESSVTRILRR